MSRVPLVVAALVTIGSLACTSEAPVVSVKELKARYDAGDVIVIDVRTAAELNGELGSLDGARNIPLQLLPGKVKELPRDTVYVVCRTGNRSAQAAAMLRTGGIAAFNVEGGMVAWRAAYGARNR